MTRVRFDDVRATLYKAIWIDHKRKCDAVALIGKKGIDQSWVNRLKLLYGEPPDCRCGRPGFHAGACKYSKAANNPRCPDCGSRSRKHGRKAHADGTRSQRYECCDCRRDFCKAPYRPARFEDCEAQLIALVRAGEKHEYMALVLGVHRCTIEAWTRKLRERGQMQKQMAAAA